MNNLLSSSRFAWLARLAAGWLCCFTASLCLAQAAGGSDPLMSLMMSQPRVETGGVVVASAELDPPTIAPGQTSIYRVTFNALEQSVDFPSLIKSEPRLAVVPGAHGQILALTGPTLQPRSTFNSRITATNAGDYTIPAFTVQVYGKPVEVPATKLEVRSGPIPATVSQHLELEIAQTNLYAGQPATVQIILPTLPGGVVQGLAQLQLTGEGFLVDQSTARQRIEMRSRTSPSPAAYIYELSVTPIQIGKVSLFGQGFVGSQSMGVIISGPGGIVPQAQYTLIESKPAELQVKPLPAGELPGFAGAIGDFALEPPRLETNRVLVGDPVKLIVTIRSNSSIGNLPRMSMPPPPSIRGWQIFPAVAETATPMVVQAQGFARFRYTLIPLDASAKATPAIPFSYFDPANSTYVDLTIPPAPITVIAKGGVARLPSELEAPTKEEDLLKLSGLALAPGRSVTSLVPLQASRWFPLVQAIPFIAFLVLWSWARRRRYLAMHPEIILRRRARAALKRERNKMRRAARSQNETEFAVAAVTAMRAACAPHYPADPRALVGADVLEVIDRDEYGAPDSRHEVVRRFFDATDRDRFASQLPPDSGLFRLQPEIEQVLERLEAAL